MKHIVILIALLLNACALPGLSQPNLSADQLKAAAMDKNASIACATGTGPWGKVNTVYVNVDRSAISNGSVTADTDCKVTVSTSQSPAK